MDDSLLPKELRDKELQKSNAPRQATKVVKGEVTVKKPTLSTQLKGLFLPEDVNSVKDFAIWDILVPSIQDGIFNLVTGTLSMIFYGKYTRNARVNGARRSNATWSPQDTPQFSYDRVNQTKGATAQIAGRRPNSAYIDVIESSYDDAISARDELLAILEEYHRVPVAAYYEAYGITNNRPWTDRNWGWTDLSSIRVVPVTGGKWIMEVPPPKPIG